MTDTLTITDLEFRTHIGAPEEERAQEQRLLVTMELHLDTSEAGKTDDLEKTINYEEVKNDVLELAKTERHIIETLAKDIAEMILTKYAPEGVTVIVKKFPFEDTDHVSITISRP